MTQALAYELAPWRQRWAALLDHIECIADQESVQKRIADLKSPAAPHVLAFVNAHAMNLCVASQSFTDALLSADTLLRDGKGMEILFRRMERDPGLNLNGTDLIPRVIATHAPKRLALYGTRPEYLAMAQGKIRKELSPESEIELLDGFRSAEDYLAAARQFKPELIVLGMGMPKQEQVAQALRQGLQHPCLIVCGGAIIDFLGGKVTRAAAWMQRSGFEWLYRFILEPRRLFRRYILGNPLFLYRSFTMQPLAQKMARRCNEE